MPDRPSVRARRQHRGATLIGLLVAIAGVVSPSASRPAAAVAGATPTILQEVPAADLLANRNGICTTGATHILKGVVAATDIGTFVSAAEHCGLKIIWYFAETVDYGTGRVYPSRIATWVNKVKGYAATWGYLSVKEPSWSGIDAAEIRSLYSALKAADPDRPVLALFGDTPNFGTSQNPYTAGMADVVMVDWYPVETTDGRNSIYLTGATKNFPLVRSVVDARTPGTPIYLMVQTHKYTKPATHKKQRPTYDQLTRQVVEGYRYLGAAGIAFHIWRNANYDIDQYRDPQMVSWMAALIGRIEAGEFDSLRPKTSDPDSDAFCRLAGPDRYATAAAISAANYPPGVPVFLATGLNFPDALAGAALAGHLGGPLLLVTRDTIPAATATELARLAPSSITILGSTGVVGYDVAHAAIGYVP